MTLLQLTYSSNKFVTVSKTELLEARHVNSFDKVLYRWTTE
jgi:hypothetical protein